MKKTKAVNHRRKENFKTENIMMAKCQKITSTCRIELKDALNTTNNISTSKIIEAVTRS